jgi:hypothetical protein
MYNAPDAEVAKYNRNVAVINQISPQFAKDFFKGFVTSDNVKKDVEWLKTQKLDMLVQPDAATGQIHTLQEQLNNAKKVKATAPKTIQSLVTAVDDVSNPKIDPSQRLNLARGFFDPTQNGEILSDKNFEKDRYDPTLKREIPGKYWVFRKLSSDNVATGIAELGKKDPSIVKDYQDTMTKNFGEQLFSREILDLRDAATSNKWKISFTDDGKRAPRFEILNANGSPLTGLQASDLNAPYRAINRLNEGISSLHNVYDKTGADANNQILKTLYQYGYAPQKTMNNSPSSFTDIKDVPGMLWNAVTGSQAHKAQKEADELNARVPVSR